MDEMQIQYVKIGIMLLGLAILLYMALVVGYAMANIKVDFTDGIIEVLQNRPLIEQYCARLIT